MTCTKLEISRILHFKREMSNRVQNFVTKQKVSSIFSKIPASYNTRENLQSRQEKSSVEFKEVFLQIQVRMWWDHRRPVLLPEQEVNMVASEVKTLTNLVTTIKINSAPMEHTIHIPVLKQRIPTSQRKRRRNQKRLHSSTPQMKIRPAVLTPTPIVTIPT